ncbi:ABC transporter permease [Leucobacter aridicollis]|uniref:Ribose transport system permease protein n=1 Tax=Leucobacter aridicollis TaxID=283878 RepID=A0A852RFN5_9MICO|nr:ABC transporter permease [Leucobacter aridicollis]MBL3680830.1 ABC transporter permease [Leucobacter aridicollis]NYD28166.1 ribose transport system permease protein [Leucobacter aridicollis]
MKTETIAVDSAAPRRRFRIDFKDYGVLIGLLVLVIFLSVSTDTFLTQQNLVNLFDQAVVIGLIAIGATLCIISGVFDLSASANLALSAIIGVYLTQTFGVGVGFVLALAVGAALGAVTGTLIVATRVHSFIGSLAMSIIYRGLAVVLTAGAIVAPLSEQLEGFRVWTKSLFGGISAATVLLLVGLVVFGLVLWGTTYGRRIYAVGGNPEAARLSGVRTELIHISVFAISGLCSAAAGMVLASRAGSAQPAMATGLELTAIAAVVIGGTSIMGGAGAVWRTAVGVLILTVIANGFNLMGWDTTYQQVVTGALILIAVAADSLLIQRLRKR